MSSVALFPKIPWTIDQSIKIDQLSLEEMRLIFSQAEKRLDDTVKEGESIASKTMSMITLMAGLLMALSGYIISVWDITSLSANKNLVAIFGCAYLLSVLIYVINNIITDKYLVAGSKPENLINSRYSNENNMGDKALLALYIGEIEEYNWRIGQNEHLSRRRWRRYRNSIFLFFLYPLVLALLYGILEWIRPRK